MCDKAGKQNWMSNILSKVQMTIPPYHLKTEEKREQNLHTVVHFLCQIKANNNKNSLVIFLSLNKTITILAEYYHRVRLSRWPCTPTQGHRSPYGNTKQWCGLPLKHQVTTEICVRESLCITIPSPYAIPHPHEGSQEWALYECWFSTNGGRFIYEINRPSCSARLHKPMVWRKKIKKKPTLTLTGSHWNNLIPASIYPHDVTWPLTVCTGSALSGPEQSLSIILNVKRGSTDSWAAASERTVTPSSPLPWKCRDTDAKPGWRWCMIKIPIFKDALKACSL